jgi:hypothetical protein
MRGLSHRKVALSTPRAHTACRFVHVQPSTRSLAARYVVSGMSVVFRADAEPAATRDERWRHVLRETLGPLDPRGVPDQVLAADAGSVRVAEMRTSIPGGAEPTAQDARRSDAQLCKIDILARRARRDRAARPARLPGARRPRPSRPDAPVPVGDVVDALRRGGFPAGTAAAEPRRADAALSGTHSQGGGRAGLVARLPARGPPRPPR